MAEWEWNTTAEGSFWRPPGGDHLGVLDLRTYDQMASSGILTGYGIFVYSSSRTLSGSVYFGENKDATLRAAQKTEIINLLGLSELTSNTPGEFMWDMFTKYADPRGLAGPKPIRGSIRKIMKLSIGGIGLIYQERYNIQHSSRSIQVFQADYRRQRLAGVDLDHLRKWTGTEMIKQFRAANDATALLMLPPEYSSDGWRLPGTPITESFDTTDSDTLGPDLTWTEVTDDIDIVSNKAEYQELNPNGDASARAETALSSADHYAQADVTKQGGSSGHYSGTAIRFNSSATTFYYGGWRPDGTTELHIGKVVAGSQSELTTADVSGDPGEGETHTVKLEITDDDLTLTYDEGLGSEQTLTLNNDTSISGNLYTGIAGKAANSGQIQWDNFEADSLSVLTGTSQTRIGRQTQFGRGLGRNR